MTATINPIDKQAVIEASIVLLQQKLAALERTQAEQLSDSASQGKSTAGDKHDTAQAMVHLEQEQNNQLWQETTRQLQFFLQPRWREACTQGGPGALITTNQGHYLILNAIGKVQVNEASVMTLSAASPLGQAMMGKRVGETVQMPKQEIHILAIQ
jgi:transcription elongation GreA/GreB family factor